MTVHCVPQPRHLLPAQLLAATLLPTMGRAPRRSHLYRVDQ